MWRLALLLVLALSVRAQDDDADRLLTSVRQPVIVEANLPNITVGFKTGPNILGTQFTIKCVLEGEGCDATPQGQSVRGSLPVKPAAVEGTVQGLEVDQTYSCFVETTLTEKGKVSYCQEATPLPGFVRFELIFGAYPNAAAFGPSERAQVCANVLTLQPGGTCSVLRVTDGSAIVLLQVEDDDYRNTWSLTEALAQNATAVNAVLASGLEGSVEVADVQAEPPIPSPLAPTNVAANAASDCTPSVFVTWTAPQRSSTITGYFVSCTSLTAPAVNRTVAATQRNTTLSIQAEEEYTCSVVSQGPSGTSPPAGASPVTYSWPSTCTPSTPTGVNASQIPDTCTPGIRVEWNEVTTGPPPSQYIVECTGGESPVQKNVSSVETTADLTPVEGNITYSCTVTSKTASGEESAASQPSSVTHSFGPGCCVLSSDCDDAGAFCSQNECISLTFQVQSDYFGLRPDYSTTRGLRGLGVSYDGSSVYTGYIHSATTAYTQAIRKVSAGVLAVEGSDTAIFGNGMPQGETVDDYFNANREDYPIQDYIKIRWGGYGGQPAYGGPDNSASNCQVWNTTENNDNGGAVCTQGPFKAWAGIPIVPGVNQKPVDIKEDDRGNVYVALEDGKRILILTSDLDTVLYTGDPGLAGEPTGLDWWKEGTTYWLYVTTEKDSGIARWDVSDPENPVKDDSWNPGVTSGSEGSAVDADGTVYVAGDDKIRKFSANGTFVMESGEEVTGASEVQIFGDKLFIISQSRSVTKQLRVLNKADLGDLVEIAVPYISPPAGTFDGDTDVQQRGSAAQFTGLGISPNGHLYLSEEIYVGGSGGIADLYTPPATTFNQNPDVINPVGSGTEIYFDRVLVSSSVCKNCPPCPSCPSLSA